EQVDTEGVIRTGNIPASPHLRTANGSTNPAVNPQLSHRWDRDDTTVRPRPGLSLATTARKAGPRQVFTGGWVRPSKSRIDISFDSDEHVSRAIWLSVQASVPQVALSPRSATSAMPPSASPAAPPNAAPPRRHRHRRPRPLGHRSAPLRP